MAEGELCEVCQTHKAKWVTASPKDEWGEVWHCGYCRRFRFEQIILILKERNRRHAKEAQS